MDDVLVRLIPEHEVEDKRLGRHVEHDPRSKNYPWEVSGAKLVSVVHDRYGGVFNQKKLGSCTGNASTGATNCDPFASSRTLDCTVHSLEGAAEWKKTEGGVVVPATETNAVVVYSAATAIDNCPGSYPPDDTGSSGLAVAKVLHKAGLIDGYKHAFSVEAFLDALQVKPVIAGIDWYEGFDEPDGHGEVTISGEVRGGHEILAREFELADTVMESYVWFDNSWGDEWGPEAGRFCMTVRTLDELLANDGDGTILL